MNQQILRHSFISLILNCVSLRIFSMCKNMEEMRDIGRKSPYGLFTHAVSYAILSAGLKKGNKLL